ncbi:acetoacetate--CoA ligase [Pseudomonas fluorescens]|uniref:Acetyl-coenzyme A synthetase n=1 Tax=Pseudomonas fluorescens TaxID=294 RepID=A0A5E7UW84_PSEFL|nr:acetoacetate--CoA ligase [Pseudomonas fluorescens]VVQ15551.1 Acetyl-coenzyme A synthetase [Pseudomonas fluorescens]
MAVFWTPSAQRCEAARISHFTQWLASHSEHTRFADYAGLWEWSVTDIEAFWQSVWTYFDIASPTPHSSVLTSRNMPGAGWFTGAQVNYVNQVFRHASDERPAILFADEGGYEREVSWAELEQQVSSLADALRRMGVTRGDRVVAFLPNRPETVIAFLACASIGAIWSVCSPDMGAVSVLDRFRQIEPKVLIACDGYQYGGKTYSRIEAVEQIRQQLPSLEQLIAVPVLGAVAAGGQLSDCLSWESLVSADAVLRSEWLPFDHPLWVVYSSGTTGMPKPIVHGHGGILLAMSVSLGLHNDLGPQDRYHWYSTTGWIMWNCQVGGLLVGSTLCIFDGSPGYRDLGALWRFAGKSRTTVFGAGAAYYASCLKAGIKPNELADLSALKTVGSTGSPLASDCYDWIQQNVGNGDVWLAPMSGGTDLAGPFIGGNPTLPVYRGEMQCRVLGAAVHAFNEAGEGVIDEVGELVCTAPMPCMPLFFWNDSGNQRYLDSYFDTFPGVWRHGDWMRVTEQGGVIIYGRSDATINRHGIRMGTSELYQAVEALPQVLDSMVVDLEFLGKPSYMPLFIVLGEGARLDDALHKKIMASIRGALTPRHVPNDIFVVPAIPRTLSGKKLELPIKKLLLGHALDKVVNKDSMANPDSLGWYLAFADQWISQQNPR